MEKVKLKLASLFVAVLLIFAPGVSEAAKYARTLGAGATSFDHDQVAYTSPTISLGQPANTVYQTESNMPYTIREADVAISKFYVYVTVNTLSVTGTWRLRDNGADGNTLISILSAATGAFQDTTSTDTISAGETFTFEWDGGTGTGGVTCRVGSFVAEPSTNFMFYGQNGGFTSADPTYYGLNANIVSTTEAFAQQRFRLAGTLKNLETYVVANSSSTTATYRTRLNGSNGGMAVSILAGATGAYRDSSGSDSIAISDLANTQSSGITGVITVGYRKLEFVPTSSTDTQLFGTSILVGDGATRYTRLEGHGASTTEADVQSPIDFDFSAEDFETNITTNATTSSSTATFRINTSDSALVISFPAGTTGWFIDSTNTASGVSGDLVSQKWVNGGGGSLIGQTLGLVMREDVPPSGGKSQGMTSMGVG